MIVAVLLIAAFNVQAEDYIPPTPDQIMAWWDSLDRAGQVEQLLRLDLIEHSVPVFGDYMTSVAVLDDGSVVVWYPDPVSLKIGYLEYSINFPAVNIPGIIQKKSHFFAYLFTPILSVLLAESCLAIGGGRDPGQYILAAGLGLAVGIGADLLFAF